MILLYYCCHCIIIGQLGRPDKCVTELHPECRKAELSETVKCRNKLSEIGLASAFLNRPLFPTIYASTNALRLYGRSAQGFDNFISDNMNMHA